MTLAQSQRNSATAGGKRSDGPQGRSAGGRAGRSLELRLLFATLTLAFLGVIVAAAPRTDFSAAFGQARVGPPALRGGGTLPPGFEEVVVVPGLSQPTALAFAPDDRLFICEKGGRVRVFKQGQLLSEPFVDLSVTSNSERGLLGIAFHPDFASQPYVYVYYTTGPGSLYPPPSPKNRVSRFAVSDDVAEPGSESILLDNIPSDAGNHNAGCLRFGLDGTLYISTGDGGQDPTNSQRLGNLAGKILRINPDGSIPPDNPFAGQTGRRGEIFCFGLRNPWRFTFRPETGSLVIADVGQNTWEEVNVGQAGGNYGWPIFEGPTTDPAVISPIYAYNHAEPPGGGASITGGCFFTSPNFPVGYQGSYFFGDYIRNFIRRLLLNPNNTLGQVLSFGFAERPVDFAQGPDGDLYYASLPFGGAGSVRKIRYVGTENRPPVARASADRLSGRVPLAVQFSSDGSRDPDGDPLAFRWDFGTGDSSTLPNPAYTFQQAGRYDVTLEVRDGRGGVSRAALVISAGGSAPTPTIRAPADESRYRAGDTIDYRGSAIDPEDGPLPATQLRWSVLFHHADHVHPFLGDLKGSSGRFVIPRAGEASADTFYELVLTATDSDGLEGTASVQIRPRKVRLKLRTSPGGLNLTLNGQPLATPATVVSVVGFDHLVGAPDQARDGIPYLWTRWSDGGTKEHVVRAPDRNRRYRAVFRRGL